MKKWLLVSSMLYALCYGQESSDKKKPTLSVNFILNDFQTAAAIKSTSLSNVLRDGSWSKINEMGPGLAINYFQGLSGRADFMASMNASLIDYKFKDRPSIGSDNFLVETDANIMLKLLRDRYIVVPYVTVGAGVSVYKVYWGAYIPMGAGIQFKLAENTFLFSQLQYRTGITQLTNNHFNYSLGFGTPIGSGKK